MAYRLNAPYNRSDASGNWNDLWKRLRDLYYASEKPRQAAVLENFRDNKENICRKMGVVSHSDIARIATKLQTRSG